MGRRRSIIINVIVIFAVAVVLAALCRTYVVELYRVAPQQMENTLLQGDRVWVEKWHYGIRLPQSYISLPFIDTIPGTDLPARYPAQPLPYNRLSTKEVSRNDIVAFNYPTGGAIPLSHYPTAIARCVGIPGDTVSAHDGVLYINGVPSAQSPVVTEAYLIADTLVSQVEQYMTRLFGSPFEKHDLGHTCMFYIDRYCYDKLREHLPSYLQLTPVSLSYDNYEIVLPPYNRDVVITPRNAAFYAHIINEYEPVKVQLCGNALYRGGRKINQYRFTQHYYWVLCDNRTAGSDSRTFGVLPHSHVIGRCVRVIFSTDARQGGIPSWRGSRFFKSI